MIYAEESDYVTKSQTDSKNIVVTNDISYDNSQKKLVS